MPNHVNRVARLTALILELEAVLEIIDAACMSNDRTRWRSALSSAYAAVREAKNDCIGWLGNEVVDDVYHNKESEDE